MHTFLRGRFTPRLVAGILVTLVAFSSFGPLPPSTAHAATAPVMLKDINTTPHSSWAWGYTEFDGLVYFGACENNGDTCGLYVTDGTEEGTRHVEVYDNEGEVHDWPNNMTVFNGALYFTSQDNNEYTRLWILTDSSDSPELVAAGSGDGEAFEDVRNLFIHGDTLYFVAREWNGADWYLWRTDGNNVPTKVSTPGLTDDVVHRGIGGFTSVGTELFFTIQTDGYAFDEGRQQWKVVNGEDAELVADFKNDSLTIPYTIASIGTTTYILVYEDPDPGNEPGFRLYEIEDTGVGTSTLHLINKVSNQTCTWDDYYDTYSLACPEHDIDIWESPSMISTGANLLILALDGNTFKPLWFDTDPEALMPATGAGSWNDVDMAWILHHSDQTQEIYYFSETDDEETLHILNYAGNNVADISLADYHNVQIWDYAFYNNKIHIFMCKEDVGCGIWRVNDSNDGFVSVSILNEDVEQMTDGYGLRPVGNDLYFTAEEPEHGAEPWIYTTVSGSRLIKDIDTGNSGSIPSEFSRFITAGNTTFFFAESEEDVLELWKTNGTENGTVRVAQAENWNSPGRMYAFNNKVYFYAYDHNSGTYPLMVSDGNTIEYAVDTDFEPAQYQPMIIFDNRLYFSATDGDNGYETWSIDTNGTATKLIDINGAGDSNPFGFTVVGSTLYFFTDDLGTELWKTDGTEGGTVMISDEIPSIDTEITYASVNNSLIFWDYDNYLYRVHDDVIEQIEAADDSEFDFRYDTAPVVLNDRLFFSAYTDDLGTELWKTDGTKEGTMVVEDFSPGADTYPTRLTVFDNHVWFNYDTEERLFYSNGDTVTEVENAPFCANRFTVAGEIMYFTGFETFDECDEEENRKLYSISGAGEPIVEVTGNFKESTSLSTAQYQNEDTARLYFWGENEKGYEPWTIGDIESEDGGGGGNNGGGGGGNNNGGGSSGGGGGGTSGSRAAATLAAVPGANLVAVVAQIHRLIAEILARGGELPPAVKAFLDLYPNPESTPVRDLEYSMEGSDVRALQTILIGQGYSIAAGATGWFGPQTRAALAAYQAASAINPAVGYFGPVTRAFMKTAGIAGVWW